MPIDPEERMVMLAQTIQAVNAEHEDSGHPMTAQTALKLSFLAVKLADEVLARAHMGPSKGLTAQPDLPPTL